MLLDLLYTIISSRVIVVLAIMFKKIMIRNCHALNLTKRISAQQTKPTNQLIPIRLLLLWIFFDYNWLISIYY